MSPVGSSLEENILLVAGSENVWRDLTRVFPDYDVFCPQNTQNIDPPNSFVTGLPSWTKNIIKKARLSFAGTDPHPDISSKYDRYILVVKGQKKEERAEATACALELAKNKFKVNVFATKNRTDSTLRKKLAFTLSLPPIPGEAHGDGFKVLPSGAANSVKRVSLQVAGKLLMEAFSQWTPGKKLVVAIETGAGKTSTLAREYPNLNMGPLLFLSPTLTLAREFVSDLNSVNPGLGVVFNGRNETLCHKTTEVSMFGAARRSISANLCQTCEHGLETMITFGSESASKKKEELEARGVSFAEAKFCGYVAQTRNVKTAKVLAAAEASLAGTPGHLLNEVNGEEKIERSIVWDDCFTPFSEIVLTQKDLLQWLTRAIDVKENQNANPEQKAWVEKVFPILEFFVEEIEKSSKGICSPLNIQDMNPPTTFSSWSLASQALDAFPVEAKSRDGVVIESIQGYGDEREIPVRAVLDLAEAMTYGTVWFDRGKLRFTIPTLSLKTYMEKGGIVMDATPSAFLRAIADEVVEIRVVQPNLYVEMDVSLFRGRTGLKEKNAAILAGKHLENICLDNMDKVPPTDLAVITHKPIEEAMSIKTGMRVGHWGAHQRGHNDYKTAKVLILDGVPVPPPDACFIQYESCRKYLETTYGKYSGVKGFSKWTEGRIKTAVSLPMKHGVASIKAYVPENPDVASWIRDLVTAELVQAIGRLRAVQRCGENLRVIICTAFPLAFRYGLEIHSIFGSRVQSERVAEIQKKIAEGNEKKENHFNLYSYTTEVGHGEKEGLEKPVVALPYVMSG